MDILKKYVYQDIEANREFFDDTNTTYKISDKKKAEWMLNKSIIGSKWVGSGNFCIDIEYGDIGIDVSVLTSTKTSTNEKSIMQCFSKDLDILFSKLEGENAVNFFSEKLVEKFAKSKVNIIYYIMFICHNKHINLVCLELRKNRIGKMRFGDFSKKGMSINIENFIQETYGTVKLYKSKKRLELRLHPKEIQSFCKTVYSPVI